MTQACVISPGHNFSQVTYIRTIIYTIKGLLLRYDMSSSFRVNETIISMSFYIDYEHRTF